VFHGSPRLSEELANAIVFIASNEASFITGHILNVDGGHTAGWILSGRGGLLRAVGAVFPRHPFSQLSLRPTPPAFDDFACRLERRRQRNLNDPARHQTARRSSWTRQVFGSLTDASANRVACRSVFKHPFSPAR